MQQLELNDAIGGYQESVESFMETWEKVSDLHLWLEHVGVKSVINPELLTHTRIYPIHARSNRNI
jgi:hypothetical protein